MEQDNRYRRYRPDFFFPILLITAGVIWLLVNNGTIPMQNVYRLVPYWPLLLIAAGLSLLFRRIWWPLSALVWAATAVLAVWMLVSPPSFLPTASPMEMKHETLRAPLGQATSASIQLDLSINPTTVHALSGAQDLLVADVYTVNGAVLDDSGGSVKTVRLDTKEGSFNNLRFDWLFQVGSQPWDVAINPAVPLDLTVNASTGHTTLDLSQMKLTALTYNASTGGTDINLPQSQTSLPFRLNASTGGVTIRVPDNAVLDLTAEASTGGITIDVPDGVGVEVNVRGGGTGGLHLPSSLKKVRGNAGEKEGIYQNNAFSSAKTPILITVDMSTGGLTVE